MNQSGFDGSRRQSSNGEDEEGLPGAGRGRNWRPEQATDGSVYQALIGPAKTIRGRPAGLRIGWPGSGVAGV